jgi:hypothetical protein
LAPAGTARSKTASGSSTVLTMRTDLPRSLRAEVGVLRRFVRHPAFARAYTEARNDSAIGCLDAEEFDGGELALVEIDGMRLARNPLAKRHPR